MPPSDGENGTAPGEQPRDPTLVYLFKFFLPLAGTSFIVTATHSMFDAGLARLPEPEIALASFAVAKSFVLIIENPISMFRHMTVAMTSGGKSYLQVRRFILLILLLLILTHGTVAFTPLGPWLLENIMGVGGELLAGTVAALRILIVLPVVAGLRNMYQGVAILLRRTPLVTTATFCRLLFVAASIAVLPLFHDWPGAALGAVMFAGGITLESAVLLGGVKRSAPDIPASLDRRNGEVTGEGEADGVSFGQLGRFFLPLSVTSLVRTLILPTINAGLARSATPEMALASFSVAWGFGNIWMGPINMMFHQCSLNFVHPADPDTGRRVRLFSALIAGLITAAMAVFAFTPAGSWVLTRVIGTSAELARAARSVLKAMCVLPGLSIMREYLWGRLMREGHTAAMGLGKVVNFATVLAAVAFLFGIYQFDSALAGIAAFIVGELAEFTVIFAYSRRRLTRPGKARPHRSAQI